MKPEFNALAALRSRFEEAARDFPDYMRNVMYVPSQEIGPRIRRHDVRELGGKWYLCDFDEREEPVLLDDPERLAYARKDEDAFWRLRTLAKELESILRQCGIEPPNGPDSTPDGRVLFWAIGEAPLANRTGVWANDNAFYLVSLAIDRLRSQDNATILAVVPTAETVATACRKRYKAPRCPICDGVAKVTHVDKKQNLRRMKCRDPECAHTWKVPFAQ